MFRVSKLSVLIFVIFILLPRPVLAQVCPLGDANNDCKTDGLDYVVWLNNYNSATSQGPSKGDFNSSGFVDGLDYVVWLNNYGSSGNGNPSPTVSGPSPTLPSGSKITFTSSSEDFPNPERGFMKQANIFLDAPLNKSTIFAKDPSDTVVWVYFHLENYRDPRDGKGVSLSNYQGKLLEPVGSGKGLDTVKAAFTEARSKGLKLVIRFLYIGYSGLGSTSDPSQTEPDMPLDWALQHINQLKPLLVENTDVIAASQAGFVGYWGEWHSSKYLGSLASRKAIVDGLLTALPKERMIQVRYPRYKQAFYGGALTDSQAFNQSDLARVALHDDAFLRDDNDGGTFKSSAYGVKVTNYCDGYSSGEIQCWRDYFKQDSRFLAVGGEAGTHSSTPSQYALCPNALIALADQHFSFLNNGYSKIVLDNWVAQGCMPEIRRRLGYRLELKEATIPPSAKPGSTLNFSVLLKNTGFAAMYNPRPVYLVLQGSSRYDIPLSNIDPRRFPPGQDSTINTSVNLPQNISPGTYKLALWLPDASSVIKNNPAYAVRFANSNTWEASTGLNILTSNFQIN